MRPTSHNPPSRLLVAGTLALSLGAAAITLSAGGISTIFSTQGPPMTAVMAIPHPFAIADAVSSVARTGTTAATATVTGGAAATGASAAALPDTTGSGTVLALAGAFLTLCAAAAGALLHTTRGEHGTNH